MIKIVQLFQTPISTKQKATESWKQQINQYLDSPSPHLNGNKFHWVLSGLSDGRGERNQGIGVWIRYQIGWLKKYTSMYLVT